MAVLNSAISDSSEWSARCTCRQSEKSWELIAFHVVNSGLACELVSNDKVTHGSRSEETVDVRVSRIDERHFDMIGDIVGQCKQEIHTDKVVCGVDCAFADSEIIEVADRSEDFQVSDLELIIIAKTGRVKDLDVMILRRLSRKVMIGPELELNRRTMNEILIGSFFKVPLMRIIDVVKGLDRVSSRVKAVTSHKPTINVIDD